VSSRECVYLRLRLSCEPCGLFRNLLCCEWLDAASPLPTCSSILLSPLCAFFRKYMHVAQGGGGCTLRLDRGVQAGEAYMLSIRRFNLRAPTGILNPISASLSPQHNDPINNLITISLYIGLLCCCIVSYELVYCCACIRCRVTKSLRL